MEITCRSGACRMPSWMPRVLVAAGVYHLLFAIWVWCWPNHCFDWTGWARPNHPLIWRGIGFLTGAFGLGFLIAARSPLRHWPLILLGWLKFTLVGVTTLASFRIDALSTETILLFVADDVVWWFPFAVMLWRVAQRHVGQPNPGEAPLTLEQAQTEYRLSSGETLAEASRHQTLVLVFLRHFGCTFTRQILRELQDLKDQATGHDARLVLVHMLSPGDEQAYLKPRDDIARIADPRCELYRAFGLGKGGFLELFGPRVWIPLIAALVRGCGVGHLAGDGLQLPGAFLVRDGRIVGAQRARSQADLPDLPRLFDPLQGRVKAETVAT